ncbi:hypothetical protein AVEN_92911-1 [Araneus ventricosus]|uniref:Uncharacterized protein n=1 Tax=Araneus ventricosus TaxID=182803 RepID=A0A4Y2D090_ARAVE|nr:hypothetical protein AVEN_92911-1 [Araneus ventricosus]
MIYVGRNCGYLLMVKTVSEFLITISGRSMTLAPINGAPLKPKVLGRKRVESDSPNPSGHLSTAPQSAINFPSDARKWAVVGKDNWTGYLLSDHRTSPPLKRSQPPQTGLRRC